MPSGFDAGEAVEPLCEVGFATMAQFGAIFTPKRWALVENLKTSGPLSIYGKRSFTSALDVVPGIRRIRLQRV